MKIMKNIFISGAFGATIRSCNDGIYRHPDDCSAFYQCTNGHRYEDQYCPEGLLFNELTSQCDWPENVDCGEILAIAETLCTDGVHPHETDCTTYYQCAHGHRYPDQYCPNGLLFDKDLLVCNWAENVECNFQSSTDPITTTIEYDPITDPITTTTTDPTTTDSITTTTTDPIANPITTTIDTTAAGNVTGGEMIFCEDRCDRHDMPECNGVYQCYPTRYPLLVGPLGSMCECVPW